MFRFLLVLSILFIPACSNARFNVGNQNLKPIITESSLEPTEYVERYSTDESPAMAEYKIYKSSHTMRQLLPYSPESYRPYFNYAYNVGFWRKNTLLMEVPLKATIAKEALL